MKNSNIKKNSCWARTTNNLVAVVMAFALSFYSFSANAIEVFADEIESLEDTSITLDIGDVYATIKGTTLHFQAKNGVSGEITNIEPLYEELYNNKTLTKITSTGTIIMPENVPTLFSRHSNLEDISGLANWDVSKVKNISYLFNECSKLKDLSPLTNWKTESFERMGYMFNGCSLLMDVNALVNWKIDSVYDLDKTFSGCTSLSDISALKNWNVSNVSKFSCLFNACESLSDISALSKWNTASGLTMSWMFYGCTKLKDISALSAWNVSRVENMWDMFSSCLIADVSPLSKWDTANVKDMGGMFFGNNFNDVAGLSNWNVSNVEDMDSLFSSCVSLTDISGISKWNTSSLTDITQMFRNCRALADVTSLGGWDLKNLTSCSGAFSGCTNIKLIDLSGFYKSNINYVAEEVFNMGNNSRQIRKFELPSSKDKFIDLDNRTGGDPFDVSYIGTTYYYKLADGTKITSLKDLIEGWDKHQLGGTTVEILSTHFVSFLCNSYVKGQTIDYGEKAIRPANPTRSGYTFVNWYSDYALTKVYDFNTPVTSDITLYAKWIKESSADADTDPTATTIKMHRLYNRWTGEHFYTSSTTEKDNLVKKGWSYEGVGWNAPSISSKPVYRLYNGYVAGGDHHYTVDSDEKDNLVKKGWSYEGIGWYSDPNEGVPLYRQYNPYAKTGTHNYSTSKSENDNLVKKGWRAEGVSWYGLK